MPLRRSKSLVRVLFVYVYVRPATYFAYSHSCSLYSLIEVLVIQGAREHFAAKPGHACVEFFRSLDFSSH